MTTVMTDTPRPRSLTPRHADAVRRRHRWLALAIIGLTAIIGAAAIPALPVAPHEASVLQSAEEMIERGDWIVPRFAGEVHLTSPPLRQWLAIALARLSGNTELQPWHGGAIWLAGVMLITAGLMTIGHRLYGPHVSLTAGAIAAASLGLFSFVPHARPDMLYTGLCTIGVALFIGGWRLQRHPRGGGACIWGMWGVLSLATLCSGPLVPVILLAGFTAALSLHGPSRPLIGPLLRPVRGVVLMLAPLVAWWLMVRYRLGVEAMSGGTLPGDRPASSLLGVLDASVLARSWQLIVPWVVIWPAAAGIGWWKLRGSHGGYAAARVMVLALAGIFALMFAGGGFAGYVSSDGRWVSEAMAPTIRQHVKPEATLLCATGDAVTYTYYADRPIGSIRGAELPAIAARGEDLWLIIDESQLAVLENVGARPAVCGQVQGDEGKQVLLVHITGKNPGP